MNTLHKFWPFSFLFILQTRLIFLHKYSNGEKSDDYTNEPDFVKPVYHYPNEYENESYKFWKKNKAFPHFHGDKPAAGRLHQHFPKYGDAEQYQNFITDPPGFGLNVANANSPISDTTGYSNNHNTYTTSDNKSDNGLHNKYNHSAVIEGIKSRIVDIDIDNSRLNLIKNANANNLNADPLKSTGSSAPRSKSMNAEVDTFVEKSSTFSENKKPCCSCCKNSSNITPYQSSPQIFAPYSNVGSGCGVGYGSSGRCNGGSGGCNGGCYGGSNCCSPAPPCCIRLPVCCAPQIPCCPRIQIPCCPVQPICCQPARPCGFCRSAAHRALRTKRFGCIPCLGRRRREVQLSEEHDDFEEHIHVRQKRLGCIPCLKKRIKRDQQSNTPSCQRCSLFGNYLTSRFKRQSENCVQCSSNYHQKQVAKRDINNKQCDRSCCDYSKCSIGIKSIVRQKKMVVIASAAVTSKVAESNINRNLQ